MSPSSVRRLARRWRIADVSEPAPFLRFARYGALAFEFSGTIAAGGIAGTLVDRWTGMPPYGVVTLTLVAVVGGFARFIQLVRRFERLDRDAEH